MRPYFLAGLALLLSFTAAPADGLQTTQKECSACHMAFPPQLLPARSWIALLDGLNNHFGENASLDAATAATIKIFLVANSAGSPSARNSPWLRGLDAADTPLRITETPFWIAVHKREVPDTAYADPKVKTKSNCLACHQTN
jgi:hypothetical protein